MKTMKRFAARICALFVVLTVSLTALVPAAFAATKAQLPDLPSSQCVVDDANILSSSTKTAIENLNAQLTQQCEGAQIGVLTVDYTGSLSTEDYAVQAANTWGLGSSSKNNGVLILLVMQSQQYADGDYYLATGDGFRNTTLEKQASAIAQTMEDSFAAGDYDAALAAADLAPSSVSGWATAWAADGGADLRMMIGAPAAPVARAGPDRPAAAGRVLPVGAAASAVAPLAAWAADAPAAALAGAAASTQAAAPSMAAAVAAGGKI